MKLSWVDLRHSTLRDLSYPSDHFKGPVQGGPKGRPNTVMDLINICALHLCDLASNHEEICWCYQEKIDVSHEVYDD